MTKKEAKKFLKELWEDRYSTCSWEEFLKGEADMWKQGEGLKIFSLQRLEAINTAYPELLAI